MIRLPVPKAARAAIFTAAALLLGPSVSAQPTSPEIAPQPVPTPGAEQLDMMQQTGLRCSAAFAIVTKFQESGQALEFPLMKQRGREFFVRTAANIMDDTGIDRDAIAAIMQRDAAGFANKDDLKATMPACLLLLDASGI